MPKIYLGRPGKDTHRFITTNFHEVVVYYSPGITVKAGYEHIEISLKKLLFWRWLELDGAKGKVVY